MIIVGKRSCAERGSAEAAPSPFVLGLWPEGQSQEPKHPFYFGGPSVVYSVCTASHADDSAPGLPGRIGKEKGIKTIVGKRSCAERGSAEAVLFPFVLGLWPEGQSQEPKHLFYFGGPSVVYSVCTASHADDSAPGLPGRIGKEKGTKMRTIQTRFREFIIFTVENEFGDRMDFVHSAMFVTLPALRHARVLRKAGKYLFGRLKIVAEVPYRPDLPESQKLSSPGRGRKNKKHKQGKEVKKSEK